MDPWTKTFDATNVGPECPQIRTGSQQVIGTEDCLVINVYVPQVIIQVFFYSFAFYLFKK